nr:unnamed protein product [Spirometra erinaceieuropaei]
MYAVVEFVNDKSVAAVPKCWFHSEDCVMWVKNHKLRDRLLVNNERPPEGTKIYPVRVLKNDLSLDRALQLEKKAVDTDDLSHSEPTELGRGMRKRFVRQLTSDDDEDDDDDEEMAAQRPRQDNQLTAWPTPPRILQPRNSSENTPWWRDSSQPTPPRANQYAVSFKVYLRPPREPSMTAFDKRLSQVQHDGECVRKKVDYVAEELVELRADITQVKATMAEILKAVQELRLPAEARPPSLKLPLCTKEAYKAFVSELEKNASFAQDAIKRLSITDRRNEKQFVRNLLTALLGHPLCLSFCWGGARDKQAFVGSPLYGLVIAAIREHAAFSNCTVDTIRKSAIDWFHGARDRYGGRSKRRDNTTANATLPVSYSSAEEYMIQSTSEDTIPATDMDGLPDMSLEET